MEAPLASVGVEYSALRTEGQTRRVQRIVVGTPVVVVAGGVLAMVTLGLPAGLFAPAVILGWSQLAGA